MTQAAGEPGPGADPTVATPEQLAAIQAALGVSLADTDPAVLSHIVERSRLAGNEAFRQRRYRDAVAAYSQAIAGAPGDAALFANRSAAYLALGLHEQAAWDGAKAAALRPGWAKAHYRLGCAHLALSAWDAAAAALGRAAEMEPGSSDVEAKLAVARGRARAESAARRAQADTERRGVVTRLRAARRADQRLAMLNQFKQSMVGPDWELEDLEWRPTFLPAMRLKRASPEAELADPQRRLLAGYLGALADLAHPKQALRVLEDEPRLQAFQSGIEAALQQRPGADALVLGAGGGLLALLAARAGAGCVTAVERSRMLYRMARQVLEANAEGQHREAVARVHLLDRRLQSVGVQGEAPPPDALLAAEHQRQQQQGGKGQRPGSPDSVAVAAGDESSSSQESGGGAAAEAGALLARRAGLLVTDLLDHAALGLGLLPALDYAAERLLAPGALVVPQRVQVYACLLELHVGEGAGFDLTALNAYWWHPGPERMALARMPHRRLSAPFPVHCLELQARLDAALARQAGQAGSGSAPEPEDGSEDEADAGGGGGSSSPAGTEPAWELDTQLEVPVTADGQWNAVAFWFDVHAGHGSGAVVTSWGAGSAAAAADGEASRPAAAHSWDQAVQYVDSLAVAAGGAVRLRVRQDSGQLVFTTTPPQCRPRHALVPRWHFDMVLDRQRNQAYDAAIRRAVAAKRAAMGPGAELLALDLGAGSGLLAMMAARAGADAVYGAEVSQHMCDVGEEATIMNGFLGRITLLDRDARRLDVLRKPDGTPPDLPRRADLLVYEVFDSGCIGEGVLHILAAAQARLLAPGAALVPGAARVWCQPIQLRVGAVLGFDCAQANRWRWRPDYEGVELGRCRDAWVPLGEPVEVFHFDFSHAAAHMAPAEAALPLVFTAAGVFNAVAMWFDLHLDEETTLSTSPYSDKGLTWQQAVQWVREVAVQPGQALTLTARHDTYSISYSLPPELEEPQRGQQGQQGWGSGGSGGASSTTAPEIVELGPDGCAPAADGPRPTGVPLADPAWRAAYDRLQGLNGQLVKACVQNPLEYRAVARAALAFAARPHDLGLDAQQAAEFCVRMMG